MNEKKKLLLNRFMGLGFMGYALLLFVERILALVFSPYQGGEYSLKSGNAFAYVSYILVIASLIAGTAFFARPFANMFLALIHKENYDFKGNAKRLAKASGSLLISGMMHTGFTLSWLQFIAYGFLILAMLASCVEAIGDGVKKWDAILSFLFLTCFSMAIPVCYRTNLNGWISYAFYISEFIACLTLIFFFGLMLYHYFENGYFKLDWKILLAMLVLDGLVLGFKWTDEVNVFLLIFVIATPLVYLIGKVIQKK